MEATGVCFDIIREEEISDIYLLFGKRKLETIFRLDFYTFFKKERKPIYSSRRAGSSVVILSLRAINAAHGQSLHTHHSLGTAAMGYRKLTKICFIWATPAL